MFKKVNINISTSIDERRKIIFVIENVEDIVKHTDNVPLGSLVNCQIDGI